MCCLTAVERSSLFNNMQWKSNGYVLNKNAVAVWLLHWFICSSSIVCIGASASIDIHSSTTAIIGSSSTNITDATDFPVITDTPSTEITPTFDIGITKTFAADITSTPSSDITSTPSSDITSTPSSDITSTPSSDITSTPSSDITSTPSSDITSTPSSSITSTASSSITSTPSAQITSTSARPSSFPMLTENMNLRLSLHVKLIGANFTDSLTNSSSSDYQNLAQSITTELTIAFNKTPGFVNITVTGFWKGSVGVNFTSMYKDAKIRDVFTSLKHVSSLSSYNGTVLNASIDNELRRICEHEDSCPKNYRCSVERSLHELQPICEYLCRENQCQNSGYCVVNTNNQPVCKCLEKDDYIYSGGNCEIKTEKLTLSKDKIIAIAVGVGGGVILLLLIVIVIICIRQRQQRRLKEDGIIDNASEQSFQSFKGSEDGIHQPTPSSRPGVAPGNSHSLYRLPEERAENPNFNPYLSLPNVQQPAGRQLDFSQGFPAAERPRETSRNIKVPNYGDPVQIPRFKFDPHGSHHAIPDNKRPKSPMTKTTNTRRENQQGGPRHPSAEPKLYDYSNDMELMPSGPVQHPLNDSDLYDFSYENQAHDYTRHPSSKVQAYDFPLDNNVKQRNGIKDPYSVKMRLV